MINARNAWKEIQAQLEAMQPGYRIRIESFKRDRWMEISALKDGQLEIAEHGIITGTFSIDRAEAHSYVKKILSREFPRSKMLRLHRSRI